MPDMVNIDLPKLIEKFGCESKCRDYLEALRWPEGVRCPRCEENGVDETTISRLRKRHQFSCDSCGYQFSVRVGTVLHDSKLPLWKWFLAVFLMVEAKKGVSANQLKRMLGVSYKTAWYLCHRIRAAMASMVEEPLSGTVEMDETFVGGKAESGGKGRGKGKGYRSQALVLGAVSRDGGVRLKVVKDRSRKTLHKFADKHVCDSADEIITDDWYPYRGVHDDHKTINHSKGDYVVGDVHTNTMESVWSLFKRSVVGTYHKLSGKHLGAYLDEMEWRYNNRDNGHIFRDTLIAVLQSDTLGYDSLTA